MARAERSQHGRILHPVVARAAWWAPGLRARLVPALRASIGPIGWVGFVEGKVAVVCVAEAPWIGRRCLFLKGLVAAELRGVAVRKVGVPSASHCIES